MSEQVRTEPPPLPYRARPPQVLLGVGAVLLVSAGAAVAASVGGAPARLLLLALAAGLGFSSLRAARGGLRSSEEILAGSAAGLALVAGDLGASVPGAAAVLAVVFLALRLRAPTTAAWPLASWVAVQLAVLRALDDVPPSLRTELCLVVALAGLGVVLLGRRVVARTALVTTAPWWLVGVLGGSPGAWADSGAERWLSAALMVVAAAGLVPARLREVVEPLLGPPRLVPVVSGVVAGAAVAGAFSSLGTLSITLTAYAGVLLANTAAGLLTGWRRGLLLPAAVAAGSVMALLCVVQLVALHRWSELSLLLLLTALPTVAVGVRRADERPVALPVALWCLAGAALLALLDGVLTPLPVAVLLTVLYGAAMAVGSALDPASRRATARAAGACALAALLLLRAEGESAALAVVLAVQGGCTLGWAWRTGRRDDELARVGWRIGAAQLVLGAWVAAALADRAAVEWYSLPAAAGLLLAAGPGLVRGSSWAWGPGLLVALVPSAALAVVAPDGLRAAVVLVGAAAVLVAGARTGMRAPLVVGAWTAVGLAVGFTVRALPWPLGTALAVGTVLLAIGMLRERRPVAGFGRRLADLR